MKPRSNDRLWQSRHRYLQTFAKVVLLERELSLYEKPRTAHCSYLAHFGTHRTTMGLYSGQGSVFQGDRVNLVVAPVFHMVDLPPDDERRGVCLAGEVMKLSAMLGERATCEDIASGEYTPAGNVAYRLEGVWLYQHVVKERLARALFRNPLKDWKRIIPILRETPLCPESAGRCGPTPSPL